MGLRSYPAVSGVPQRTADTVTPNDAGTVFVNSATGNLEAVDANGLVASTRGVSFFFGNGSDGDVSISGTVTLARDMQYRSLTVPAGATLNTNGFRVLVNGVLNNAGTIACDGGPGQDGFYSATFPVSGFTYSSTAGGTGGTGGGSLGTPRRLGGGSDGGRGSFQYYDPSSGTTAYNGVAGTNLSNALGGTGGAGGQQQTGVSGGVAFRGTAPTTFNALPGAQFDVTSLFGPYGQVGIAAGVTATNGAFTLLQPTTFNGGAGGGGGGWGGSQGSAFTSRSGGGGGGGGVLLVVAETIINTGTFSARGGNGGLGTTNCGPGGGGGGGVVLLYSRRMKDSGTSTAAAGSVGSGSAALSGTAGSAGSVFKIAL